MASSGAFNTSQYEGRYLTFSWSLSSQSIENNTSTISWKVVGAGCSGYVVVSECHIKINGDSVYDVDTSHHVDCYVGTVIASGTKTITHSVDGSKSFSASVSAGIYVWAANCSGSDSWALTTIPRASSLTLPSSTLTIGEDFSFSISAASNGFSHDVVLTFGGDYFDIGHSMGQGPFSRNLEWVDALASKIPNSVSGSGTLTLHTYNCFAEDLSSRTLIGSKSYSVTLNLPPSIKPSVGPITVTPAAINGNNILVQNKNKITVSISGCSAGSGSSIKSYTFYAYSGSTTVFTSTTTNTSVTWGPFSQTGTLTFRVFVTDNRGRSSYKDASITCYAYAAPSFTSFSAYRSDSSGTANDSGTSIKCSFGINFSSVNSTNDITVKIYYKKSTASSYSSTTVLTDSTATSSNTILNSIALDSTYMVYATVTDNYSGNSSSTIVNIFGASRVLNITSDGTGIAFGKMAESAKLLESRYRMKAPGLMSTRDGRTNTSLDINADDEHLKCLEYYIVKSGITGAPSLGDGHIIHCHWDNTGGWDSQLYLKNSTGEMMSRGCNSGTWGSWNAVQYKPTTLYSGTGITGTIPNLSYSAADFTYLEIFYTDNASRQYNSVKVYSPNGKYVTLACIEPRAGVTPPRVYIRTSGWVISDTTMIPYRTDIEGENAGVYCQLYQDADGTNVDVKIEANRAIKIIRIVGYK